MSRIYDVIRRYDAARSVISSGVSVFAIGDPVGAQLNAAVRGIRNHVGDDDSTAWAEVLRVSEILRWRRITQPQPNKFSPFVEEMAQTIAQEASRLRNFVDAGELLDQLEGAAMAVATSDNPVGAVLLGSLEEVGPEQCVVVASRMAARVGLLAWLGDRGVQVVVPSELEGLGEGIDVSFAVGPPIFIPRGLFPRGLVTAPVTSELTFVMPAWFSQRALLGPEYVLQGSDFSDFADGGIEIRAKVFQIGDIAERAVDEPVEPDPQDIYYPQPEWGSRTSGDRDPLPDETEAWKVLLGGGLALWLDDGERIRSLDPTQPVGARVTYESIEGVVPGTYLLLRDGETERQAMYDAALSGAKGNAAQIKVTQDIWKQTLTDRLAKQQIGSVVDELARLSVRSATRVRAWTEPTLICPKRAEDFSLLLGWLGIPEHPTYSNAITLRRALYKASAELGRELEEAVGRADLKSLIRDGIMHLDLQREGFRGMIVARVLARSPFTEIVPRQRTRIPFEDGGAKWLE